MALADLAEKHAEPELLEHLFVYEGNKMLLVWWDAFLGEDCPLYISGDADEQCVRNFAAVLGLELTRVEPDDRG
ncbi:MAG TPA: hypothetical protein VMU16_02420 [Candidatus Binataceae bacterium]|nr:hypothetical protein [Candidatus Binataceae bacterium]